MKQLLTVFFLIALAFGAACTIRRGGSAAGSASPQRVSATDTNASEPAVATAKDGGAYVVWIEHREKEADVMLRRFNGAGQPLGDPIRINPQPGQATAWRGDPPTVAVATDGTLYVGWTARVESANGNPADIYLSASRDGGKSFGSPVKINDDQKPAVHGMHSLAISDDGRVYVAWLDERNVAPAPMKDMKMDANSSGRHMESNREVFFASSVDGGRTFSQNQRVATDVCPCCKTSLAVAKDGRVYLSWRQVLAGDYRHIAVSSSSDQGQTFAKATIVSDDEWMLKGCPVSGAALLTGADASLRVLWYAGSDKGQRGIYWSESRDAGKTFTPRQLLAASSARGTPVLLKVPLVSDIGVWQSGEGNKAQILSARLDAGNNTVVQATTIPFPGELPAAAVTNQRVFIVYIASESMRQTVWLMSTIA